MGKLKDCVASLNAVIEQAAKTSFSERMGRIFWAVVRKTLAWNKERERLSIPFLAELTGLPEKSVKKGLALLLRGKVLLSKGGTRDRELGINLDFSAWGLVPTRGTNRKKRLVPVTTPSLVPAGGTNQGSQGGLIAPEKPDSHAEKRPPKTHQLRHTFKDTLKLHSSEFNSEALRLGTLHYQFVMEVIREFGGKGFEIPPAEAYAKIHEEMLRIERRTPETTEALLRWIYADTPDKHPGSTWPGWATQTLGPEKLRKRNKDKIKYYDALLLKMNEENSRPAHRYGDPRFASKKHKAESWGFDEKGELLHGNQ